MADMSHSRDPGGSGERQANSGNQQFAPLVKEVCADPFDPTVHFNPYGDDREEQSKTLAFRFRAQQFLTELKQLKNQPEVAALAGILSNHKQSLILTPPVLILGKHGEHRLVQLELTGENSQPTFQTRIIARHEDGELRDLSARLLSDTSFVFDVPSLPRKQRDGIEKVDDEIAGQIVHQLGAEILSTVKEHVHDAVEAVRLNFPEKFQRAEEPRFRLPRLPWPKG